MRNQIFPHYFGGDYETVFETVRTDLPLLNRGIHAILDRLDGAKKDEELPKKKSRQTKKETVYPPCYPIR